MTEVTTNPGIDRAIQLALSRESLLAVVVLLGQILLLFAYLLSTDGTVLSVRHALYPFVWTTLGVWLVLSLRAYGHAPERAGPALVAATVYLLVLGFIGGTVGLSSETSGLQVVPALPGWGPIIVVGLSPVRLVLVPFEVIGYLSLSYGVYRAVATASSGALAGLLGLFSCLGCSLGLAAAVASALSGTTVAVQAGNSGYGVATAVFVLTVVFLLTTVPTVSRT